MQQILVSIYCLAYNHEEYIRDALEGFVNQKTTFNYEVIVHDDASTDNTAEIIQEYAEKYPNIIKPIFQKENQLSQGIEIIKKYICPKLTGKYVAVCEGDDYWCDTNKLQMQVDFLENHNDYVACVHNTKVFNCVTGEETFINSSMHDMDIQFKKVVESGNSQFQISSLMCRKEYFELPDILRAKGFTDYPLSIYLMFNGKIRYLKETMSVYRWFTKGSWTSRNYLNVSKENQLQRQKDLLDFLYNLKQYTKTHNINKNYYEDIVKVVRIQEVKLLLLEENGKKILENYKDIYDDLSMLEKLKLRFPRLRKNIRKLRGIKER